MQREAEYYTERPELVEIARWLGPPGRGKFSVREWDGPDGGPDGDGGQPLPRSA